MPKYEAVKQSPGIYTYRGFTISHVSDDSVGVWWVEWTIEPTVRTPIADELLWSPHTSLQSAKYAVDAYFTRLFDIVK